jgi:CRISPR-associated protein Cmr1
MHRKTQQSFHALESALQSHPQKAWKTYHCTLVTPMYGGGVEAGNVDHQMPIRASSIRGQLRFWWRIACGPFSNPKEMFEKETSIWGGIGADGAKASRVNIRVSCKSINDRQLVSSESFKDSGSKYILGAADAINCLKSGYKFNLEVSYQFEVTKDIENQIATAIRWWMSFGGLGGRVRRGFGTVDVQDLVPISRKEVESLGGKLVFGPQQFDSAEAAWQKASFYLYQFRQGKNLGRNIGQRKPVGRSRWPEADQLRYLTGKTDNGRHIPKFEKNFIFPRAVFGLPIQFQFPGNNDDPKPMILQPVDAERLASPLILKAYHDVGKWKAAALLLPNWQAAFVEELKLNPNPNNNEPKSWPDAEHQEERDRLANAIQPMKQDNELRANDPLSAFLDYFEKGQ